MSVLKRGIGYELKRHHEAGGKGQTRNMEIMRKVEVEMDMYQNRGMEEKRREEKQIEDMVRLLDGFADSGDSRLKINMSDELETGQTKRAYHHGRCDIGSPWACGKAFDAQTEK